MNTYNARADQAHRSHTVALPEPFFGRFLARVVVLMLNPGFAADGVHVPESAAHEERLRGSMVTGDSPHLHLARNAEGNGAEWWTRATRALSSATSKEAVSEQLLALEFSPYRSIRFGHGHYRLPSQAFTFSLLQSALQRNCEVVVARGFEWWVGAVPELAAYPRLHSLRSPQQSALSERNLGAASFHQVVSAIAKG